MQPCSFLFLLIKFSPGKSMKTIDFKGRLTKIMKNRRMPAITTSFQHNIGGSNHSNQKGTNASKLERKKKHFHYFQVI